MKMDKKGRPRPDGYKMEIEPKEAAIVLWVFTSYADGVPLTRIVKTFNEEGVPGAIRAAKGWSTATISRILDNEKYAGRWICNRTESRRDPKTGRRRRFEKPESEWIVRETKSYGSSRRSCGRQCGSDASRCTAPGRAEVGSGGFPAIRAAARSISRRTCSPAAWSAAAVAARSLRSAARAAVTPAASPAPGRM
jgi:hypothetical protein